MRRYMLRAIAVQTLVLLLSLFSCGPARAAELPAGFLAPSQIQGADYGGILVGLFVAMAVCFFVVIYLLIVMADEISQVKKLIRRISEADL